MSIVDNANIIQYRDVAKYSKASCFGLRTNIKLQDLVYRQMILRALEYNDSFGIYTTSERQKIEGQIATPIFKNNCTTC